MPAQLPSPAELYEGFYGPGIFQPLTRVFLEFAAPRPGERVLDLACGTGMVARHVAPLVGGAGKIVALDINPDMLQVARRAPPAGGAKIEWREGDAVTVELVEGAFDLVLCQQGLQFFDDPLQALRRMYRALATNGRIALAVWKGLEHHELFGHFAAIEARHLEPLGVTYDDLVRPFSLGDPDRLRELLEDAGFAEVEIVSRTVEARFPSPATFARNMETAYGAVVPAFVRDPAAFENFVEVVERETRDLVERYTAGDVVSFAMPTFMARAFHAGHDRSAV